MAGAVGGRVSDRGVATSTGSGTDVTKVDAGFDIAIKYLEKLRM